MARADAAEQNLSITALLGGLPIVRATSPTAEAQAEATTVALCSLACRRAARGSGKQVPKQARAATTMAAALAAIQLEGRRAFFRGHSSRGQADDKVDSPHLAAASAFGPASGVPYCVNRCSLQ